MLLCNLLPIHAEGVSIGDDWTSTNHNNGSTSSKTYTFTAGTDAKLSFDWSVSSESGFDNLIVTLDGTTILTKSGSLSGTYNSEISQGEHTLVVKYTKDNSQSSGSDQARVSNLTITAVTTIDGLMYSTTENTAKVVGAIDAAEIVIPSSVTINNIVYHVTSIGSEAFKGCNTLTSITIPESVTSIGSYTFRGCSSLTSITIPESVTSIGNYAFYNCSSLTEVHVSSIEAWCNIDFEDYSSNPLNYVHKLYLNGELVTELVIPESVTSIGSYTFSGCSSLTEVHISSIEAWCNIDFEGYSSNPLIYAHKLYLNGELVTELVIPESVTSIGDYAFYNCSSLTDITIPECVTEIGGYAFVGTAWYINQPDGLIYAGNVLHEYKGTMPKNTSIEIKGGTISISPYAFNGCSDLSSITLPESVTEIGDYAFKGCSGLYKVINNSTLSLSEGSSDYGYVAYYAKVVCQGGELSTIDDFQFYTSNGIHSLVDYNGADTTIVLPDNYNGESYKIGDCAFNGCSRLTSITIPESVTEIGDYAFRGCSSLTSIAIPECVTEIGDYAFYGCSSLTSITIPESVAEIGDYAFRGCSSLTSITIPESVTEIGYNAFYGCMNLKNVYNISDLDIIKGSSNNGYVAYYAQKVVKADVIIDFFCFVTKNDINYLNGYSGHDISLILPEDYNGDDYLIYEETFMNNDSLVSVEIPQTVGTIGRRAFSGCSKLTSVEIARGVMEIEDNAFENCTSLSYVTIPKNLLTIGNGVFAGCSNLATLTFLEGVETIGDNAFEHCACLTNIIFPESLTAIGRQAFKGCCGIETLYITPDVETIGDNAFEGCTAVETLTVMGSVMPMVPSDKLTSITLRSPQPLETEGFANKVYRNATLYVPEGSLAQYQVADVWKNFWTIEEFDPRMIANITIDQCGSGTYCSMHALDFSEVTGLKAYVATGYNTATGEVTLTRVMTAKPREGLFLKGTPGNYEVPTMKSSESYMQNLLVGTLANTVVNSTSADGLSVNYEYIVKEENTTPLFYKITDGSVLEAGKAYLQLPKTWLGTGATRAAIGLRFDDEEMEFGDEEQSADVAAPAVIYDLQGRRVANPTKGVFIVNGKKVVFK